MLRRLLAIFYMLFSLSAVLACRFGAPDSISARGERSTFNAADWPDRVDSDTLVIDGKPASGSLLAALSSQTRSSFPQVLTIYGEVFDNLRQPLGGAFIKAVFAHASGSYYHIVSNGRGQYLQKIVQDGFQSDADRLMICGSFRGFDQQCVEVLPTKMKKIKVVLRLTPSATGHDGSAPLPLACASESPLFQSLEGGCKSLLTGTVYGARMPPLHWHDAAAYCANLNIAAHDDWRLPTATELSVITNPAQGGANHFRFDGRGTFWSGTAVEGSSETHYAINLESGRQLEMPTNFGFPSLCVRTGSPGPTPSNVPEQPDLAVSSCASEDSLFKTSDGGCKYLPSGIVFAAKAGVFWWEDAASYCKNFTAAGFSDWRTPTAQELTAVSLPAQGGANHFRFVAGGSFWSADADSQNLAKRIAVVMDSGRQASSDAGYGFNTVCVRSTPGDLSVSAKAPRTPPGACARRGGGFRTKLGGCQYTPTGRVFSQKQGSYHWSDAMAYCENLNEAGFGDWRLPIEVDLIKVAGVAQGRTNHFAFPLADEYWTASVLASDPEKHIAVHLQSGRSQPLGAFGRPVVCVRN